MSTAPRQRPPPGLAPPRSTPGGGSAGHRAGAGPPDDRGGGLRRRLLRRGPVRPRGTPASVCGSITDCQLLILDRAGLFAVLAPASPEVEQLAKLAQQRRRAFADTA